MSELPSRTIPIPPEGFLGIQALVALGGDRLDKLAQLMAGQALNLSFSQLSLRLSGLLDCDQRTLYVAFVHALIPLNGLRRSLEMSPSAFLAGLVRTTSERAPADWQEKHQEKWAQLAERLLPFLQPDNFFSQAAKAFDLLSERPAVLQGARILTELRPIYNEETTNSLAHLLTSTLVVDYWDGRSGYSLHISLDADDLEKLDAEVQRAKQKINVSRNEAAALGANLVVYGNPED